jgi:serine/threonine protein kinase
MGSTTDKDIEKEVNIIHRICTSGHKNIVQVLGHGSLKSGSIYYIDMELRTLNLRDYIHHTQEYSHHASALSNDSESTFITEDSSAQLKSITICTIIDHVTPGLEFIHNKQHIHRDLIPLNHKSNHGPLLILVLYSSHDKLWEIADFGLTTEGTSKHAITTESSKGTEGYRAPELLLDDPKFSNKVDVWAVFSMN